MNRKQNIFSFVVQSIVIVYYFQIWNKKEHNFIISRIISSQVGLMYLETPYIYPFAINYLIVFSLISTKF